MARRMPRTLPDTAKSAMSSVDFRKQMEEYDGTFAPNWEPEKGDLLVGRIVRYGQGPKTKYGVSAVVTIREDSGKEWSVWLSSTVLRNEFRKQNPLPGEEVGLKYLGLRPLPEDPDSEYHHYFLRVNRSALGATAVIPEEEETRASDDDLPF